jgi:hypothetical protein
MATVINSTIAGLNAMTYLPTGFNPEQAYPLVLAFPGAGEIGTNAALMLNAGPFTALLPGVDLGLNLIVVEIQNQDADPRPVEMQAWINAVKALYKVSAIIGTGYSRSGQDWDWFAGDAETDLAELAAIFEISSEGPVPDEPGIPGAWEPQWFVQSGVQWWGVCGDQDSFYDSNANSMLPRYQSLLAVAPKQAFFTVMPGQGHSGSVWNTAYAIGGVKNAAGQDFWHWAASFGAAATGTTPPPVVVAAPAGFQLPVATTAQLATVSPVAGLQYYNSTTQKVTTGNGTSWT